MIYVPTYDTNNCVVIKDAETIRVYDNRPQDANIDYTYTDYFYTSHYYSINGIENFNDITSLPICISDDNISTDFYYRSDIADILIVFIIFVIIGILLPIKLFSRLFRRFLR